MPPSTSQVSLPSQIGATEFMMSVRASSVGRERRHDADAEVEAVEEHVHEHGQREDAGPDGNEIDGHGAGPLRRIPLPRTAARAARLRVRRGCDGAAASCAGRPRCTSFTR